MAHQLDWSAVQVRLLLDGTLPPAFLTDNLLKRIGAALHYDIALIEIILGRSHAEQRDNAMNHDL